MIRKSIVDNNRNTSDDIDSQSYLESVAFCVYAYATPVILFIGLSGNSLSLFVFLSQPMRKLSASVYLAALSSSDIMSLLFYVLTDWLNRGLPHYPHSPRVEFLHITGVCQLLLYLGYISRFMSSWIVTAFTVERYIGVCHPLKIRGFSGPPAARKVIAILVAFAVMLCLFKPLLSEVNKINTLSVCSRRRGFEHISFVLDIIFGISITLLPFIVITVLNILIVRKLFHRNRNHKQLMTEESVIKLEFTLILLAISLCFIVFNLPYFTVWSILYLRSDHLASANSIITTEQDKLQGILILTRIVFFLNYCVNFFLYSVTGSYFRKELKQVFRLNAQKNSNQRYGRCNSTPTKNSWV